MNKWNDIDARRVATRKLCELLDKNNNLRERCKTNQEVARETLRAAGDFEDMPGDVEVRIMEDARGVGDKLVAFILPEQDNLPPLDRFDPATVWRCTYQPYSQ